MRCRRQSYTAVATLAVALSVCTVGDGNQGVWSGTVGGAQYTVSLAPWTVERGSNFGSRSSFSPYTIQDGTKVLLQGQVPAIHCFNQWHTVGDGTLEWQGARVINGTDAGGTPPTWGAFTAANISWKLRPSNLPFHTSVVHYTDADLLVFEQHYGGDCDDANFTELPSNRSATMDESTHASLNPSSEFPVFAAPEDQGATSTANPTLLSSDATGFFTTGGVMTYTSMAQGFGLKGFKGGAEGGPLILLDSKAPNITRGGGDGGGDDESFSVAMVISTGNHFTSSILGHRRTCSRASWRRGGASKATLASSIDLSRNDIGGISNITEAQCSEACISSPMCNAYTYGSAGCGTMHCRVRCYLKSSTLGWKTGSSQQSGYFCKDDPEDTSLVAGPLGYLRRIPAGTLFKYVLVTAPAPPETLAAPAPATTQVSASAVPPGSGSSVNHGWGSSNAGVTATVDLWGTKLRAGYQLRRSPSGSAAVDPVGRSLGYWTDNGAIYDGRDALPTANMTNLFAQLRNRSVPARYLQLDPYWYKCCDGGWMPDKNLYGTAGLPGLTAGIDASNHTKLLLYHTYWSRYTEAVYQRDAPGLNFTFVSGFDFLNWNQAKAIFQIHPSQSHQFFDHLFGIYVAQGVMVAAEADFLNWHQLTIPELFSTLDGGQEYLAGFAAAALSHGISHQMCMALPSQIMSTLQMPAVTNARASPDNTPTNENRWKIGYTSLLMWPLDVQPFFDNVWTEAVEPAEPYGPGVYRHNVELQFILSVLTAGPVGIADEVGRTNGTRTLQSCSANGTLLQTDKPATPIDDMFSFAPPSKPAGMGEVWQTHTRVGSMLWRYIVAIDVNELYLLQQHQLWPRGESVEGSMVVGWHARYRCAASTSGRKNGVNSSVTTLPDGCGEWWGDSSAFKVATGPMAGLEHGYDMLLVAPVVRNADGYGIVLLGEPSKIVSVSGSRFLSAIVDRAGMHVTVAGAANETVSLLWYTVSNATVLQNAEVRRHSLNLALPQAGVATASLEWNQQW